MDKSSLRSAGLLILCIVIPLLAGMIGSLFTTPAITTWYAGLQKPFFTPPNWVFFPVWTALYILMGISLYLIVQNGLENREIRQAVAVFSAQLAVNALWSFAFFGMQSPQNGLITILVLLALVITTIVLFWRISKPAAILLVPYVCWVCIATALNAMILVLN
jgi:tryptophan-rich sensory protein